MTESDTIGLLYAAALGESAWEDALASISRQVEGATVLLCTGNPSAPGEVEFMRHQLDFERLQDYGFGHEDSVDPLQNPSVAAGTIMPLGRSYDYRAWFPERVFRETPLYESVRRDTLTRWRIFTLLREPGLHGGGFVTRSANREISEGATRRLDRLLPHVSRALRLRAGVERHRSLTSSLQTVIERLSIGVLLLDRELRVRFQNAAAAHCLAAGDGLSLRHGRLHLDSPPRQLEILRRVAMIGSTQGGVADGESVGVPRRSGLAPYTLRIFPASGTVEIAGGSGVCAMVMIHDPGTADALPEACLLIAAYGLTPAEASVARLVPLACSKRVMAERLGLSENTVKTHLTTIRAKVGARNLGELLRILEQLAVLRHTDHALKPARATDAESGVKKT